MQNKNPVHIAAMHLFEYDYVEILLLKYHRFHTHHVCMAFGSDLTYTGVVFHGTVFWISSAKILMVFLSCIHKIDLPTLDLQRQGLFQFQDTFLCLETIS